MKKSVIRIIFILCLALVVFLTFSIMSGCTNTKKSKGVGIVGGVDLSKLKDLDINIVSHFDPGVKRDKTAIGQAAKWWKQNVGGNVNLNIVSADIYPTKVMAMIASGNSPDLVMVAEDTWMPRFAVVNILEPVDSYVKAETLPDYEKNIYNDITWKNKHYSLMVQGAWAPCIWYNKTMFTNNGIKTPREYWDEGNWNWDTFLKVAKELTQDTNNDKVTDQWGYANWSPDMFAVSNNASMTKVNKDGTVDITWDKEPFAQAVKFEQDLVNVYKVTPSDFSFHVNSFKAGKLAMSAGMNDFVRAFCQGMTDEVDNAPLPLGPNQDKNNIQFIGNSLFLGIGKGSKNVDGARAFTEKIREFYKEVRKTERNDPDSSFFKLTDAQVETCKFADSKVVLNYEKGYGNWQTERWNFWTDVLFKNVPVATAIWSFSLR